MHNPPNQTPIYKPNYHDALSPRNMWKDDPETKKPKVNAPLPAPKTEPVFVEDGRESYKALSDDEKNLICAGIVLSGNWRKFLRPLLESFANPPRKTIKSDADYYELLNSNAVAAFANELISTLEGRARRSPSYQHPIEEELPNE